MYKYEKAPGQWDWTALSGGDAGAIEKEKVGHHSPSKEGRVGMDRGRGRRPIGPSMQGEERPTKRRKWEER
jgi:hypothetical protein